MRRREPKGKRGRSTCGLPRSGGFLCGIENLPAFDLTDHATKARAIRNLGITLWAIIVIAALALIITVVAWFAIP